MAFMRHPSKCTKPSTGPKNSILTLYPTRDEVARAEKMALSRRVYKSSTTGGAGYARGFLAEIIAARYLYSIYGDRLIDSGDDFDYDIVIRHPSGNPEFQVRIDVKSMITKTGKPKEHFDVKIHTNLRQKCDLYLFCRVAQDMQTVYICGAIPSEEFKDKAKLRKKGTLRPVPPRHVYSVDTSELPISSLYSIEEAMKRPM